MTGRCAPTIECGAGPTPRPVLWAPLAADARDLGPGGHDGVATAGVRFDGSATVLPPRASLYFPGTSALLVSADALTFSIEARIPPGGEGRTLMTCRTADRGFETYDSYMGVTTCAGDGYGPPYGWGACDSVDACVGAFTHFVLRWRGVGTEPEVASNGGPFVPLVAREDFPVEGFDLFDAVDSLSVGTGAGDGSLARGSLEVRDLRVYDSALSDDEVWRATRCPPSP